MKNLNVIVASAIIVFTVSVRATTNTRGLNDKFECISTCVAVDFENRKIVNMGPAVGRSEIDAGEAFAVMAQDCANAVAPVFSYAQTFLARSIRSGSTEATSSSYAEVPHGFQFFDFGYAPGPRWFSRAESSSKGFTYTLVTPNLDDCKELKVNKKGEPKYIGPEHPMG